MEIAYLVYTFTVLLHVQVHSFLLFNKHILA